MCPRLFLPLLLCSLSVGILTAQNSPPSEDSIPEVAVFVNGEPIFREEIEEQVRVHVQRTDLSSYPPEQATSMVQQARNLITEDLIGKRLLLQKAREEGIQVSDEEVDRRMQNVIDQVNPGASLEEYVQAVGINVDRFRRDARDGILLRRLIDLTTGDIENPTDEEVEEEYLENREQFERQEAVQASHILIRTQGVTEMEALEAQKKKAEDLREDLKNADGETFAKAAREHGEDNTAEDGGNLNWILRGQTVPAFEEVAFNLEPGKVSEVVQSPYGYHLIMVHDRTEQKQLSLDEVRERLRETMRLREKNERMQDFVKELIEGAELTYPDTEEKNPASETASAPKA